MPLHIATGVSRAEESGCWVRVMHSCLMIVIIDSVSRSTFETADGYYNNTSLRLGQVQRDMIAAFPVKTMSLLIATFCVDFNLTFHVWKILNRFTYCYLDRITK